MGKNTFRKFCFFLNTSLIIKIPKISGYSCSWDNFTSENEIACYYSFETESSIKSDFFNSDHFGKMPRFRVIFPPKERKEKGQVLAKDMVNRTDITELDNPFVHVLEVGNIPPYLNNSANRNLHVSPVVHRFLSVHVRHYTMDHFSVLIKPYDEGM